MATSVRCVSHVEQRFTPATHCILLIMNKQRMQRVVPIRNTPYAIGSMAIFSGFVIMIAVEKPLAGHLLCLLTELPT